MKKTFITSMPDHAGAFLQASRALLESGVKITRVSYNKAVDIHISFLEVEGDETSIEKAGNVLKSLGFLQNKSYNGNVVLLSFKFTPENQSIVPVLELIDEYSFNISYVSLKENSTNPFEVGIFVKDEILFQDFLTHAGKICSVSMEKYDKSEKNMDNTSFYLPFSEEISEKMHFDKEQTRQLMINANQITQNLDETGKLSFKTFEYLSRFVDYIIKYRGDNYNPRISTVNAADSTVIHMIEPPCGSNVYIIEKNSGLLFIDSSFPCYREELLKIYRSLFPHFDQMPKTMLLTHADADHCGYMDIFDRVYMSRKCYDNFVLENKKEPSFRERIPAHAPYYRINLMLIGYKPPKLDNLYVLGGTSEKNSAVLTFIGTFDFDDLHFEVYEGQGGHIDGETVYIERNKKIAFTGDIYLNLKGLTKEQAAFNKVAPFLMTSVDSNSKLAAAEREEILKIINDTGYTLLGGHGSFLKI